MSIYHDRSADCTDAYLLSASGPITLPRAEVLGQFGVKAFIRIAQNEYPEDAAIGDRLVHFNLPTKGETVGEKTVLARIIKNGHYIPGVSEVQPLLSLDDVWVGRLTRVIVAIEYEEIALEFFRNTIGNIRNVSELKERILARYRCSMPALSEDQILGQGVSIREIELIQKVSKVILPKG